MISFNCSCTFLSTSPHGIADMASSRSFDPDTVQGFPAKPEQKEGNAVESLASVWMISPTAVESQISIFYIFVITEAKVNSFLASTFTKTYLLFSSHDFILY